MSFNRNKNIWGKRCENEQFRFARLLILEYVYTSVGTEQKLPSDLIYSRVFQKSLASTSIVAALRWHFPFWLQLSKQPGPHGCSLPKDWFVAAAAIIALVLLSSFLTCSSCSAVCCGTVTVSEGFRRQSCLSVVVTRWPDCVLSVPGSHSSTAPPAAIPAASATKGLSQGLLMMGFV